MHVAYVCMCLYPTPVRLTRAHVQMDQMHPSSSRPSFAQCIADGVLYLLAAVACMVLVGLTLMVYIPLFGLFILVPLASLYAVYYDTSVQMIWFKFCMPNHQAPELTPSAARLWLAVTGCVVSAIQLIASVLWLRGRGICVRYSRKKME
jgi:hypothetical protein